MYALLIPPLALLLRGYSGGSSAAANSVAAVNLRRAQARWARSGVRDYAYTLRVFAFGLGVGRPARVTVQNGRRISIAPADGNPKPLETDGRVFPPYDTVDDLFGVVQQAIDTRADRLDVEYDPVLGYPTEIEIDYIRLAADDEFGVAVSKFEATR